MTDSLQCQKQINALLNLPLNISSISVQTKVTTILISIASSEL